MPITIGDLTNVPNPGSPISSPWAQAASRRVISQWTWGTNLNTAYADASNGTIANLTDGSRYALWEKFQTGWAQITPSHVEAVGLGGTINQGASIDRQIATIDLGTSPRTRTAIVKYFGLIDIQSNTASVWNMRLQQNGAVVQTSHPPDKPGSYMYALNRTITIPATTATTIFAILLVPTGGQGVMYADQQWNTLEVDTL